MKKVDDINIINIKDDKNENKENKEIKENEGEINIINEKPEDDKDINNPTLFSAQNNNKNLPNNFSINDFDEDNESNMSEANKKKKTFSLFD